MTYREGDSERCLGYLVHFASRGVFEAVFGRLEVSVEEAQKHNRLLSQGEIDGLDQHCAVGMGGTFYCCQDNGHCLVITWLGQVVSREVRLVNQIITFVRQGRTFRGRLRPGRDCFSFKRIQ